MEPVWYHHDQDAVVAALRRGAMAQDWRTPGGGEIIPSERSP
jgi:hypothetical protein